MSSQYPDRPSLQDTQKRKSFLRRLSFSRSSSSSPTAETPPPIPALNGKVTKNRSVTAPISYRDPVGGMPYEQQQKSAAPARPARRVPAEQENVMRGMNRLEIRDNGGAGGSGGGASPHDTPVKQRYIHPALASPPTSPPRMGNATTPYGPLSRSTLPPPLQFGPVTVDVIASSQPQPQPRPSGTTSQISPSPPINVSSSSSQPQSQARPPRNSTHTSPSPLNSNPSMPSQPRSEARPQRTTSYTAPTIPGNTASSSSPQPQARPPRTSSHTSPPPPTKTPSLQNNGSESGVSEASAYAQAHRGPSGPFRTTPPAAGPSPSTNERRASRPLPRPPSTIGKSSSGADIVLLSSSPPARPALNIPAIEFARSPTLPDLVDPRHKSPSSPMSPVSPTQSQTFRKAARRPKRLTLAYLVAQPRIQARLLPLLPINSFLSLIGASAIIRKAFTGEAVGRWVTKEWGIRVDQERGRSWPNLTVWEGFLEAMLHDPATYHTYPPKWHNLLQHLCLSYTLVVLHLRNLPASAFPASELPFEEDISEAVAADPTLSNINRMARHERLVELVMPSPLASAPPPDLNPEPTLHRRGSVASLASTASMAFTRKRSNSLIPSSASIKPPPSYPIPKRYGFKTAEGQRSRTSSESGRPGSVFSYQSSPSIRPSVQMRHPKNLLRASFASSDPGRLPSPGPARRIEPIFDQPPPFTLGRAPCLRVFVPLSERVPRWPSAEGAMWTVRELDKCGATKRLRLGDLVINTAIQPRSTEHILMFVPFVKHLLVPLEYTQNRIGHLPSYIDAFTLPPSYYHPLLSPTIIFLDLAPFASQAMSALRLAYDRRDVTVSSGARVTAKRYIHVTGFEVSPGQGISPEWQGIVSLEAEGTAEGKIEIEKRLGGGDPQRAVKGAWEIVREKSMKGNVWLRLYTT